MKCKIFLPFICSAFYFAALAQNVGIGTATPAYKLDVAGIINSSSNAYIGGYLGIGTTSPAYKIQVENGSVALHNSIYSKLWLMTYISSGDYFSISESLTPRLIIKKGGNVGIGNTAPAAKLDITGTAKVSGSLTVNNNKGVLYNLSGSTNIKQYTRTASFNLVNLGAHTLSPEATIGFIGGFSAPPQVYVGDIVSNGGSAGPLYQLQLIIYDVTATNCHCRILNTSNSAITQTITWNIMCMGN